MNQQDKARALAFEALLGRQGVGENELRDYGILLFHLIATTKQSWRIRLSDAGLLPILVEGVEAAWQRQPERRV